MPLAHTTPRTDRPHCPTVWARIALATAPMLGMASFYTIRAVAVGHPQHGYTVLQCVAGWLGGAAVVARLTYLNDARRELEVRVEEMERHYIEQATAERLRRAVASQWDGTPAQREPGGRVVWLDTNRTESGT